MTDHDRGTFGPVLRRLRVAAGLSQEELAERARLSVESISALERGRRKAPYNETIRMLGDALRLTPDQRQELSGAAKRPAAGRVRVVSYDSHAPAATANEPPRAADENHNLVRSLSPFFGRTRELAELTRLVGEQRLITLVGAGGIGKTRIALEFGWGFVGRFSGGVWFIDLAPLGDHSTVTRSFLEALRVPLRAGADDREALEHHLRRGETLLIVDNCEHVVGQVAVLLDSLLPSCSGLRVLATSREPLRLSGEQIYRIRPLGAPDDHERPSAEESLSFASIALFVDRARAANAAFTYDEAVAPIVAKICRRLDGIALAIELAAARSMALSPAQILEQLEHHFRILSGGRRTALARQQTMHETIKWSYDRLSDPEQRLFRRLAIFPDGFSTAAVDFISRDDRAGDPATLELLMSLVDKSLVAADSHGLARRSRLLEPVRAFGSELLREADETNQARSLFADWCLDFARRAHETWATAPTATWFEEVEPELENQRSCLVWALAERNDIELGQRLISTGRRIWARLSPSEGADWVAMAQRLSSPQTPRPVQAALALAEAHLSIPLERYATTLRLVEQFERLDAGDDALLLAEARSFAAVALTRTSRGDEGEQLMAQCIAVFRSHHADQLAATGMTELACSHLMRDNLPAAQRLLRQALAIFRRLQNSRGIASVSANLAEAEYSLGNIDSAISLCREALATSSSGPQARACLSNLAAYLIRRGDFDEARECGRESLAQRGFAAPEVDIALAIQRLAAVAALRHPPRQTEDDQLVRAACLLGFVDERLSRLAMTRPPTESYEYDVLISRLNAHFGAERCAELREEGSLWRDDEAIEEALRV